MNKKSYIFVILITLGFLASPSVTYACGSNQIENTNTCCQKESKGEIKECCKKHKDSKEKNDNDCDGKCGNSSCHCVPIHITFHLPNKGKIELDSVFNEIEVVSSYYNESYISSGFYSIWTPPNIG